MAKEATEAEGSAESTGTEKESPDKKVLFQRHIAIFNVTDPARLFSAKLTKDEEFSMLFTNSEKNKEAPLEVQFNRGSQI